MSARSTALHLALVAVTALSCGHPGGTRDAVPSPAARPRTPTSTPAPSVPAAGDLAEIAPAPGAPPFRLTVHTAAGDVTARVVGLAVAGGEPVDPPHATAQEWATAVFVENAAYPASPSTGTTYVYGHACRTHVCPFTGLYRVTAGDAVRVEVVGGVLTYRVERTGRSPRSAAFLPDWARDSRVRNRIVLVTCAYDADGSSSDNLVVTASLVAAAPAGG